MKHNKSSSGFVGATSTRPADRWEEGFLSGNGTMGVVMFGNPYEETIVLNHYKLYLPAGSREIVCDAARFMPEVKEASLDAGKDGPKIAHELLRERTGHTIVDTDPFHPAGFMALKMAEQSRQSKYRMTEDFTSGELIVGWTDELGEWERKLFVSRTDNVIVWDISGPKGELDFVLSLDIEHDLVLPELSGDGEYLSAHVIYARGKGGYDCVIRARTTGGSVENVDGKITVSGADRVLITAEVRAWRTPLPESQSEAWASSPKNPELSDESTTGNLQSINTHLEDLPADYGSLFAPHAAAHSELFSRVSLDLDSGQDRYTFSETLLRQSVEEDRLPRPLMETMYDACRYLTICSAGDQPPNLMGIWTGVWDPPWSGDYTLDSNIQLAIQSIMSTGMPEFMMPYFALVESWLPDCRLNAKKFYGCRGIVSNARASNTCLLLHWGKWPGEMAISCMGWIAHFFYDYYQFTGDKTFLAERVVPLLIELALFYEDLLKDTEDKNGKYRFYISYSPENGLGGPNATIDIAVAKAVLTYLINSCEELEIHHGDIDRWRAMLGKLPPYLVNNDGGLQEWAWPGTEESYNHRHNSHLLPLYQFCEFDREQSRELWDASEMAFNFKVENWLHNFDDPNSNHITHGMMNLGQAAARLGKGEIVHEVLSRMATRRYLYPSLMISYWPGLKGFGSDPVGTIPDVVNNSLVYAWDDVIDVLPALPEEWPRGTLRGVLLRGQIKVSELSWDIPSGAISVTIVSAIDQTVAIRLPENLPIASIAVGPAGGAVDDESGNRCRQSVTLPAATPCIFTINI